MALKLRKAAQILFFIAFIALIAMGRVQMWMFILLLGIIGALFFGRFYCGWICPINTLTEGIDWIYGKLKIKRLSVPKWAKSPIGRYMVLALFIGVMIFTIRTGKKLPVLPILTALGVLVTMVFTAPFWHRYLCPYGTLLNGTGAFAKRYLQVANDNCIKCGICKKVCPGEAVIMESREVFPKIDKGLCLECLECVKACPKDTIHYGSSGLSKDSEPDQIEDEI